MSTIRVKYEVVVTFKESAPDAALVITRDALQSVIELLKQNGVALDGLVPDGSELEDGAAAADPYLAGAIASAVDALNGDSNDAEHDALYELLEAIAPDALARLEDEES